MREFISRDNWTYREKQVIERETGKSYTLTDPVDLFKEDYYTVRRAIAVENCKADEVPENDFYVYEFVYMTDGCKLNVVIVDFFTAYDFIHKNLQYFMKGTALREIEKFFESEE